MRGGLEYWVRALGRDDVDRLAACSSGLLWGIPTDLPPRENRGMLPMLSLVAAAAPVSVPTVPLINGIKPGSTVFMPTLAGGTAGLKGDDATAEVLRNFAAGLTHVHTAFDYFNLPEIGAAIAQWPRDSLFISSMTSPCFHAAPPERNVSDPEACYNLTIDEVGQVLKGLGVAQLDLLMLHGPSEAFGHEGGCGSFSCALNAAQWKAYSALLAMGKARAIGVSNFCASCLECLVAQTDGPVPATNQLQLHVGMGADPRGLISYNAAKGIVVQVSSSPKLAEARQSSPTLARRELARGLVRSRSSRAALAPMAARVTSAL